MEIILIILITSIIQSLFGVGVLLFGTPILLLYGYPFFEILQILLPVSISINFMQIIKDYKNVDYEVFRYVMFLSVPFIIIFMYFISKVDLNVSLLIGFILIIIALKDYSKFIKKYLNKLLFYNRSFFIVMGVIHGMTNLGGSLLTAKVFSTNLNKLQKRSTVAISYMSFAFFQILTIFILDYKFNIDNLYYIFVGLSTYLIINKLVFKRISNKKYDKLFAIFLFFSGLAIIFKNL